MILYPIVGTGHLGIWPTGTLGTVRITTYGDTNATFVAAELIAAIQEEAT